MYETHVETFTSSYQRELGRAVCDRCGHVMSEADHASGYNNLTLLRFRAGHGSKFGDDKLVEADFCDTCLFVLVSRYVRLLDDSGIPDSIDFFRIEAPKRLYAEHQLSRVMAEGLVGTVKEWIKLAFDPSLPRKRLEQSGARTTEDDGTPGNKA